MFFTLAAVSGQGCSSDSNSPADAAIDRNKPEACDQPGVPYMAPAYTPAPAATKQCSDAQIDAIVDACASMGAPPSADCTAATDAAPNCKACLSGSGASFFSLNSMTGLLTAGNYTVDMYNQCFAIVGGGDTCGSAFNTIQACVAARCASCSQDEVTACAERNCSDELAAYKSSCAANEGVAVLCGDAGRYTVDFFKILGKGLCGGGAGSDGGSGDGGGDASEARDQ